MQPVETNLLTAPNVDLFATCLSLLYSSDVLSVTTICGFHCMGSSRVDTMIQLLRANTTELSISILCFKCFSKLFDQRPDDLVSFFPSLLALLVTLREQQEVGQQTGWNVGRLLSCPLRLLVLGNSILFQ